MYITENEYVSNTVNEKVLEHMVFILMAAHGSMA